MSQTKAQLIDTLVASLLPASDSAVDIGSNAVRFANIYGDNLYGSGANLTGLNIVTDTSPQLGGNLDVNTKNILFGDSASASDDRLIFGAGSDLQIYHDGSNSYVADVGTGNMNINGSAVQILNPSATEVLAKFIQNAAVELYYDNSKKLETTSGGVQFSGTEVKSPDNCKFVAGTSGDADFYHDGSNTILRNLTGDLCIRSNNNILFQPYSADELFAKFTDDGAVELYHNNVKKFETTADGVTTNGVTVSTGNIQINNDTAKIRLGASQDLEIFHDGTNSHVTSGTGQFFLSSSNSNIWLRGNEGGMLDTAGNEYLIRATSNGSVKLFYDNVQKFETTSSGVAVTGNVEPTGNINIPDSSSGSVGRARFGAGADLQIYHDGSHSYIEDQGTGQLRLKTGGFSVLSTTDEMMIKALQNNQVELYYDNTKVLQTHDASGYSGIDVLGDEGGHAVINLKADEGDDGADCWQWTAQTNGASYIKNLSNGSTYEYNVKMTGGGAVELYYDAVKKFETTSTGVSVTGNVQLQDEGEVRLGTNNDIRMFHANGNANFIQSYNDVDFRIHTFGSTAKLRLQVNEGENSVVCIPNDSVELYHNGNRQVFTIDGGMNWQDNKKAEFGNSGDLKIYHDGNHSYIQDTGTGKLRLTTNSFRLLETDNSSPMITADENGAVTLNYDGSKKFETLSSGVTISGGGLNVQRSSDAYSGAIYFAGFGDTNHVVWQDHYDNPNGTRGTGNGFDGIKWNCYAGFQLFRGNEAETIAKFLGNGACELYFDNVKQINTHPNGIFTRGIYPMNDNSHNIGSGSERFNTIFATNSSINTSDITEKNTIVNSDLGLDFINKLNPISYKWNKDDGKTHYGLIAQDVEKTLISIGKTVSDFGGIHKEDNSPMGLGYSELIAPLIKAIQELSAEVAALKAA